MRRLDNLYEKSNISRGEIYLAKPSSTLVNQVVKGQTQIKAPYKILVEEPKSFKEVLFLSAFDSQEAEDESENSPKGMSLDSSVLLPPDKLYTDAVPEQGEALESQVDDMVNDNMVQQFYEAYLAPTGFKDVYNRLGSISGQISDIHFVYPKGLRGVIAEDNVASWRTSINYSFQVTTGLKDSNGADAKPETYTSLAFPPFINHNSVLDFNTFEELSQKTEEEAPFEGTDYFSLNATDRAFDLSNLVYRRGKATYRFPAYKQISDNIHLLQNFFTKCFGIENTYITEWDLSMYIQEGLLQVIEKEDSGNNLVSVPQYVTTLTYGLLTDSPIKDLYYNLQDIDIAAAETFATVNMAVSTRLGVDNSPLSTSANEQIYEISRYPYSAYWAPNEDGNTLKGKVKYYEDEYNDDGSTRPVTRYASWDVSSYIISMLGYEDNGLVYSNEVSSSPSNRNYTFKLFRGDNLVNSTKNLLEVIHYTDARNAILSGWNGTDTSGSNYLSNSNNINDNEQFSNAYSYLPFWKQFYTSEEDGMSDIDKYMQEVTASGDNISWLTVASNIIDIITADNTNFKAICESKQNETGSLANVQGGAGAKAFYRNDNSAAGSGEPSDLSFSLFKCKLTIPNSKLLKMFAKKGSEAKKAQQQSNKKSDFSAPGGGPAKTSTKSAPKVTTPEKVVDEYGNDVSTQVISEPDDLNTKQVEGVGIAEHSPFLFGGPHGMYYNPNTLEGYCQIGNRNLASVPTVDLSTVYRGGQFNQESSTGYSKNFKEAGSYADITTVLTPNERDCLLNNGGVKLGVKGIGPNNAFDVPYTSNIYTRDYYDEDREYYTIRIFRKKIRIPKFWHWKIAKFSFSGWSVWFSRWYNYSYSIHTRHYQTRSHTTRREIIIPVENDWVDTNFYLLPVTSTDLGALQDSTASSIMELIKSDTEKYFTTKNLADSGSFNPRNQVIWDNKVNYLLCPSIESSNTVWGNGVTASYNNVWSTWKAQCDHLWITGAREFTATLPIADKNGTVLNYVCGVVKVTESIVDVWNLKLIPYTYKRHHSRWHCCHNDWRTYYQWEWRLEKRAVHNCFFMPNRILWNMPTKALIDKVKSFNTKKDLTSSDIVARHKVDDTQATESFKTPSLTVDVGKLYEIQESSSGTIAKEVFPFTEDFMERFGWKPYSVDTIPGNRSYWQNFGDLKFPRSKGFYYGDFAENFKKNNNSIMSVTKVRQKWDQWNGPVYYNDTRDGRDNGGILGFIMRVLGSFFGISEHFSVTRQVLWTADNSTNEAIKFQKNVGATENFLDAITWDSVLASRKGGVQHISWYRTSEAMEVYIETATKQISWLEQLKEYAQLYFKDYLLVNLVKGSVDPIIYKTTKLAVDGTNNYSVEDQPIGFTDSWTEDLYYEEPLAMLLNTYNLPDTSVEGVETEDLVNQNTLLDLVELRITQIKALKTKAIELLNDFNGTDITKKRAAYGNFVILATDTWSILQQAKTSGSEAKDLIKNGVYNLGSSPFLITGETKYDLVSNPGVALYSYLNLLYQVRKFWVKCRFNKQDGSYWFLRGLERVLVFMKAAQVGITKTGKGVSEFPKTPETFNEKSRDIVYVQNRASIKSQTTNFEVTTNPDETGAVYIKVNYIEVGNITKHPDYSRNSDGSNEKFKGRAIQYVDEVFKYCYLPEKGPYYILSTSLINKINTTSEQLTKTLGEIYAKTYVLTEDDVKDFFEPMIQKEEAIYKNTLEEGPFMLWEGVLTVGQSLGAAFSDKVRTQELANRFTTLVQTLLEGKQYVYNQMLRQYLKKIYIKWDWHKVQTGLNGQMETVTVEGQEVSRLREITDGIDHIDQYQAEETAGKERTVTDLYGYEHKTKETLEAGITFNVAASLNPNLLLGSTDRLKKATVLETLCATVNTMDLWRIEIPEGLSINMEDLADKPVLVPAYSIEGDLAPFLGQNLKPTSKTVLAGAPTTSILPVQEASEGILTLNTLAALGKMDSIEIPTDSLVSES